MDYNPKILLLIGATLLLLGVAIPILIILQFIPSTLFLNFFAFTAQFLGLILGMVGAFTLVIHKRRGGRGRRDR